MSKLLFCLQLSPVDADAAVDLAELIAELDSVQAASCAPSWLISYRHDTPLSRIASIERSLCSRFDNVWQAKARHFASGWPAGSNALWRSTMEDVAQLAQSGSVDAVGVLTFEPDCVPLGLDWIDRLEAAYAKRKCPILGNLHGDHINGNGMFPVMLAIDWPQLLSTPSEHAWDYFHREFIMAQAADTPLIIQYYRRRAFTVPEWQQIEKNGQRPALLHGVKDKSGRTIARSQLLPANRSARRVARQLPRNVSSLIKSQPQSPM